VEGAGNASRSADTVAMIWLALAKVDSYRFDRSLATV
jgi:hypothetical protein